MYQPLVSVIIPTYNRAYALPATIEAVLNQTYKNLEIIIVDDGSTDNTESVVTTYGNKIRYIQKDHSGQGDTRNVGLHLAKGEIIAPLDSDDIWNEDFLELSVKHMLENQLDMFFSNWAHHISSKIKVNALAQFLKSRHIPKSGCYVFEYSEFRKILIKDSLATSSSLIVRKSEIPFGWNPQINIGDDYFLQLEMIFKNPKSRVGFTDQVLWQKNVDTSNICDGRKGVAFRQLIIDDLLLINATFKDLMSDREKEIFFTKILQNKILVICFSILERKIGKEMKQIFIELFSKPKLLFFAVKTGILKILIRKIPQTQR
ncbi:glycosyltransferase family 2 protein [Arundinibacter roseus]|uniref:Glycosyltransferase family 2 protein n=1 Tax=Arundinibacter roseus TaxID=2070510 RepID=A0A4R4KHV9_9BACT|nr:glycosyltransferase family A protein [Arundinibacter roseus]TDB67393.1 glycosyltransferase family 2 protein [Arundinibacter roseus]